MNQDNLSFCFESGASSSNERNKCPRECEVCQTTPNNESHSQN